MVAPLKRKNTIEQNFFRFDDAFFYFSAKKYLYEDIEEIRFVRSRFELKTIGVGSDYSYSIAVEITINKNEKLKLIEQPTFFSSEKVENIKYIEEFLKNALSKSWENRIQKYIEQVQRNKFFTYANWNFYINDREFYDSQNNKKYSLNSVQLFKNYGTLVLKEKNESFASKFANVALGKQIFIDTLTNTDVFYALLSHYYNLNWEN
jgi:hypothetical protein